MEHRVKLIGASVVIVAALAGTIAIARETSYGAIERGRYLASAGDCAACHTADGGKPYAGGRPIPTPFGTIYSTNITPDAGTGIGHWSNEEFYSSMHSGIGKGGKKLYPAMPYPWYTKLSRDDVLAMRSFLNTLEPIKQENKPNDLPWPLDWRPAMAGWNALYFHEGEFRTDPNKSPAWNRGAYLVEGLGHCGACHTPKNALGAVKTNERLQGGLGENWYASSLTGDLRDGLGSWSSNDIVEYLKTGSNSNAAAAGPMAEVVANSTQHLTNDDLMAIATYLKEVPARNKNESTAKVDQQTIGHGQALYVDNCAGCHMDNGSGLANVFPPLKASAPVQASDPRTVVMAIVGGAKVVATSAKPTGLAMPAFGWKLSDADIADLATYIRNAWGNKADAVSASQVAKVRKTVDQSAQR